MFASNRHLGKFKQHLQAKFSVVDKIQNAAGLLKVYFQSRSAAMSFHLTYLPSSKKIQKLSINY